MKKITFEQLNRLVKESGDSAKRELEVVSVDKFARGMPTKDGTKKMFVITFALDGDKATQEAKVWALTEDEAIQQLLDHYNAIRTDIPMFEGKFHVPNKLRAGKTLIVATYPVEGDKRKLYKMIVKDDISHAAIDRLSTRLINQMLRDPEIQNGIPNDCREGAEVQVFHGEKADIAQDFITLGNDLRWLNTDVQKEYLRRLDAGIAKVDEKMKNKLPKDKKVVGKKTGSVTLDIPHDRSSKGFSQGAVEVNGKFYAVDLQWFDEPSQWGIGNGRISRLLVTSDDEDGKWVIHYDRGWDVRPKDAETRAILKAILQEFDPDNELFMLNENTKITLTIGQLKKLMKG